MNRLKLDFSLQSTEERLSFVNSYLPTIKFVPNEHEAETLSNYILWGKNKDGLNAQQEGITTLKEWAPLTQTESLEGLIELPGFQETKLRRIDDTHYKTKRITFNREETLQQASPYMREVLSDLFRRIDETELLINYYEINTGKRTKPPREPLLARFTEEEQTQIAARALKVTPRRYIQLKHYLVELRTEQYTYKDSVVTAIMPRADTQVSFSEQLRIGEDFKVRPVGLFDNTPLAQKIFSWPLNPEAFTEEELKQINTLIWSKDQQNSIDFEDPNHILMIYKNVYSLQDDGQRDPDEIYGASMAIVKTLKFYESIAALSPSQRELLEMKIKEKSNLEIKDYINEKYGTTYNENYISTIYRQKILQTIAKAATLHRESMENIFYPENFKRCRDCGQLLLRCPEFFTRQKKSSDGFAPRCKRCQKLKREEREKNEIRIVITKDGLEYAAD